MSSASFWCLTCITIHDQAFSVVLCPFTCKVFYITIITYFPLLKQPTHIFQNQKPLDVSPTSDFKMLPCSHVILFPTIIFTYNILPTFQDSTLLLLHPGKNPCKSQYYIFLLLHIQCSLRVFVKP